MRPLLMRRDRRDGAFTPRTMAITLVMFCGLSLSACADASTLSGSGDDKSASAKQEVSAASDTEKTETKDADQLDATGFSSLEDCVIGDWTADPQMFVNFAGEQIQGILESVGGEIEVVFAEDGVMTTYYHDWSHTFLVEDQRIIVTRVGTVSADYEFATDGSFSMHDTFVDSDVTTSGMGMDMTVAATPDSVTGVPFSCDVEKINMQINGEDQQLDRK